MHATAERQSTHVEANPFLRLLGDVLTGLSVLFGFAATVQAKPAKALPAAPVSATVPEPTMRVVHTVETAPPVPAERIPIRTAPTALGVRVVDALAGQEPLRKIQIAALVGIGRGSANRIVDRLVEGGWLIQTAEGTYVLA